MRNEELIQREGQILKPNQPKDEQGRFKLIKLEMKKKALQQIKRNLKNSKYLHQNSDTIFQRN